MKRLYDLALADAKARVHEEPPGSNRGPRIDQYNRNAGVVLSSAYCASAVSTWALESLASKRADHPDWDWNKIRREQPDAFFPVTASSQEFMRWFLQRGRLSYDARAMEGWRGALVGFTLQRDPRRGHVGLVKSPRLVGGMVPTIEANTGPQHLEGREVDGGRNGDGVYERLRAPRFGDGWSGGLRWWYLDTTGMVGGEWFE